MAVEKRIENQRIVQNSSVNIAPVPLAFNFKTGLRFNWGSTVGVIENVQSPGARENSFLRMDAGAEMTNEDLNGFKVPTDGTYIFSFAADSQINQEFKIKISGDVVDEFSFFSTNPLGFQRHHFTMDLTQGQLIYIKPSNSTTQQMLIDGFKIELDSYGHKYPTIYTDPIYSGTISYRNRNNNNITLQDNECYLFRITPTSVDPTAINVESSPQYSPSREELIVHKGDFTDNNPVVTLQGTGVTTSRNLRDRVLARIGDTTQGGGIFDGDRFLQPMVNGKYCFYDTRLLIDPAGAANVFKFFIINPYTGTTFVKDISFSDDDSDPRFYNANLTALSDEFNLDLEGGYIIGVYKEPNGNNITFNETEFRLNVEFR